MNRKSSPLVSIFSLFVGIALVVLFPTKLVSLDSELPILSSWFYKIAIFVLNRKLEELGWAVVPPRVPPYLPERVWDSSSLRIRPVLWPVPWPVVPPGGTGLPSVPRCSSMHATSITPVVPAQPGRYYRSLDSNGRIPSSGV